jgi:N-acetylneuraminic acid mutarotase
MSSSSHRRKKTIRTTVSRDSIIVKVGSGLLFCLLLVGMPRPAPAQARWIPAAGNVLQNQTFVVSQNERGEVACREATSEERRLAATRNGGGPMRVIYSGAPRRKDMPYGSELWTSDEAAGLTLQVSAGLRIVLHGTSQLEQNQTAKNAFIVAANRWEAIISTPITVVIDVDFGTTFFGQPYPDPSILGATGLSAVTGPYSDLRQRLINGGSTTAEQQLYNALPATAVPVDFNGISSNVTSVELSVPNARALGIVADISDPNSVPLGQGDAGIGFNSAFQFDFNPDDGISSGLTDFDSVASHEIGHALGFISDAGDAASPITVWDLFRFRPAVASLATFGTATRVMSLGGSQVFFGNQTSTFATLELALSTGGPDPGPGDGDGRQSSHWKDDALFSTRPYIGIMDPTLGRALRRTISENDIMTIDLFGYSIGAPAPVRPSNDNFVNGIVLQNNSGSLTGSNVSATREADEPNHASFTGDKSVWYSWLSPVNGQITIDTIGSNFDTTLAVYTGASVNQLITIAANDDIVNGQNKASRVQFNITAGTTYRVAVDGWNGEYGNITLNWNATGVVPTPTPTPTATPTPTPTPSPTPSPTPTPPPPCLDDLWNPTSMTNAPSGRRFHTAVWTGSEMIVWGGQNQSGNAFRDGARYNPSTDTWTTISITNAPAARFYHSAVWTGSEMIIWGGVSGGFNEEHTGGRYNPSTDTWRSMSAVNGHTGRTLQTAVWTGTEMIVWGGELGSYLNSGSRYNPSTDRWTATSTTNAPVARGYHTAVWSGSEMIIWGGFNGTWLNSGGRYNPATDSWTTTTTTNAPAARAELAAIWSGSEMIIWGGSNSTALNTGGKYNPNTDSWTATTTTNAPAGRSQHTAVWSGTEMIIWGGRLLVGGRYSPAADAWIATCDTNAPAARISSTEIWTGSEMIVWGGDDSNSLRLNIGGRYSLHEPPAPTLLLEASGPVLDQAAALDSSLFLRDPFPVVNGANVFNQGADRNTRVIVFVSNLFPAEPSSSVIVHLVDSNNQSYDVLAEDVRPASAFVQVTFRLPNNLAVGTCTVTVKARAKISNAATIRIRI